MENFIENSSYSNFDKNCRTIQSNIQKSLEPKKKIITFIDTIATVPFFAYALYESMKYLA